MRKAKKPSRALITRQLHNHFMASITSKQEEIKLEAMADLAIENQSLLNASHPCFMFKGVWYSSPAKARIPNNGKGVSRRLHISLVDKAHRIITDKDFGAIVRKSQMSSVLGEILRCSRSMIDLERILPFDPYEGADDIQTDYFEIGKPLNQEERQAVIDKNAKGLSLLKQLGMLKLLLSKV